MNEAQNRFRQARSQIIDRLIRDIVKETGKARILDVGGTVAYWSGLPHLWKDRPVSIHIVNMTLFTSTEDQISCGTGDACNLSEFADNSFDLVHSNSVIEHVGDAASIRSMAEEIKRLAPAHYVQTPNYYFPIEPHYRLPLIHWAPEQVRAKLLRKIPGQLPKRADMALAMRRVRGINLLTPSEMRELFPSSRIVRERFFGLTKSLTAVREAGR